MKKLVLIFAALALSGLFSACDQSGSKRPAAEAKFNPADFEKMAEFTFTVPADYSSSFLESFRAEFNGKIGGFDYFLSEVNGQVFRPSEPLKPGEIKTAYIYRLKNSPGIEESLAFIASQNGQAPNAQGLALVWKEANKDREKYFPRGSWILGLDKPKNIAGIPGNYSLARIGASTPNHWEFSIAQADGGFPAEYRLLFFR